MTYKFRRTCAYLGAVEYEVMGDGPAYRVEVRREAGDYFRSIYNGSEPEWQRDVVASIDLLRRCGSSDKPIPADVVAAFNNWLQTHHADQMRKLRSEPERYGEISDDDPLFAAPRGVTGAHYVTDTGWVED